MCTACLRFCKKRDIPFLFSSQARASYHSSSSAQLIDDYLPAKVLNKHEYEEMVTDTTDKRDPAGEIQCEHTSPVLGQRNKVSDTYPYENWAVYFYRGFARENFGKSHLAKARRKSFLFAVWWVCTPLMKFLKYCIFRDCLILSPPFFVWRTFRIDARYTVISHIPQN